MDETVETKLVSILEWAETWAKTSENFVVEQSPLYVQELLNWGFWGSLIPFIFCCIGLINAAIPVAMLIKTFAREHYDGRAVIDSSGFVFYMLFSLLVGLISVFAIWDHLDWFQISIAPRVWILEHISQLLK